MDFEKLKKSLFDLNILSSRGCIHRYEDKVLKLPEIHKAIFDLTSFLPEDRLLKERLIYIHRDIRQPQLCLNCEINVVKLNSKNKFPVYCSLKCSHSHKDVKEKRVNTCIKKYGKINPSQVELVKESKKDTCIKNLGVAYPMQSEVVRNKSKEKCLSIYGVDNVAKSEEIQEKIKQTNLERYGFKSPVECAEIQEKIKQTNLERYGFENPQKNPNIKKSTENTCLERYGSKTPLMNLLIKEKIKATLYKNYGVENPSQSEEIKKKKRATCFNNYGVEYPTQSEEIQNRVRQTCLQRYGVEYSLQSEEIQDKIKQTNMQRYGVTSHTRKHLTETQLELLEDPKYLKYAHHEAHKSLTQLAFELGLSNASSIGRYFKKYNIEIKHFGQASYKAIKWLEHIMEKECIYIQHAQNDGEYQIPTTQYKADGYCKELNIIFEFYGDCWHGNPNVFKLDECPHPYKLDYTTEDLYLDTMCREEILKELGYIVISIWEHDWEIQYG